MNELRGAGAAEIAPAIASGVPVLGGRRCARSDGCADLKASVAHLTAGNGARHA